MTVYSHRICQRYCHQVGKEKPISKHRKRERIKNKAVPLLHFTKLTCFLKKTSHIYIWHLCGEGFDLAPQELGLCPQLLPGILCHCLKVRALATLDLSVELVLLERPTMWIRVGALNPALSTDLVLWVECFCPSKIHILKP